MTNYIPVLIVLVLAVGMAALLIIISRLLGKNRPTPEKLAPYECGVEPVGTARERQSVRFYLVAMVFLLFDIEAIFLVPWEIGRASCRERGEVWVGGRSLDAGDSEAC